MKYCSNYKKLERLFVNNTGINPKLWDRIIQFNYATQLIFNKNRTTSFTRIVYEAGYYDQAHSINFFKRFAGITPSEYLFFCKSNCSI